MVLINPVFICAIKKSVNGNSVRVYTMDGQSYSVNESLNEVLKKIKEAGYIKITM
jgi:uncharacterized protein YlzI (FlbEa/FlbD family)